MPGLSDAPMSTIYEQVNFWRIANGLTPEDLAAIAPSIVGKTNSNTYTRADWLNIRYYLSSLLP